MDPSGGLYKNGQLRKLHSGLFASCTNLVMHKFGMSNIQKSSAQKIFRNTLLWKQARCILAVTLNGHSIKALILIEVVFNLLFGHYGWAFRRLTLPLKKKEFIFFNSNKINYNCTYFFRSEVMALSCEWIKIWKYPVKKVEGKQQWTWPCNYRIMQSTFSCNIESTYTI